MKAKSLSMLALGAMATIATGLGAIALFRFDGTPGSQSSAPQRWPEQTKVARAKGRAQILVFAHPLCSCSQATLSQLESLSGASIAVEFFRPGPASPWAQSATWNTAKRLPAANIDWDDGGKEALRFGSGTSGTVLLYSAQGDLLFQGGITPSRGHQGESWASCSGGSTANWKASWNSVARVWLWPIELSSGWGVSMKSAVLLDSAAVRIRAAGYFKMSLTNGMREWIE